MEQSTNTHDTNGGTSTPPPPSLPPTPVVETRDVKRLYRTDGPVSGVAAGLADYFNVDASLIRLGLVAGTLLGGPVVPIGYVAAWLIIPQVDQAPAQPLTTPSPAPTPADSVATPAAAPAPADSVDSVVPAFTPVPPAPASDPVDSVSPDSPPDSQPGSLSDSPADSSAAGK